MVVKMLAAEQLISSASPVTYYSTGGHWTHLRAGLLQILKFFFLLANAKCFFQMSLFSYLCVLISSFIHKSIYESCYFKSN